MLCNYNYGKCSSIKTDLLSLVTDTSNNYKFFYTIHDNGPLSIMLVSLLSVRCLLLNDDCTLLKSNKVKQTINAYGIKQN